MTDDEIVTESNPVFSSSSTDQHVAELATASPSPRDNPTTAPTAIASTPTLKRPRIDLNLNLNQSRTLVLSPTATMSGGIRAQRHGTLRSTILRRPSPFASETGSLPMGVFDPSSASASLSFAKVLVVGAGGLGCETLKNLALSGLRDVHVIDMDTIDVTNLNRQFLFRPADVGAGKAETAAAFVRQRVPTCAVTAHRGRIQDKPREFYAQFDAVVSGLDNVEARRWLNATVVGLAEGDEDGDPDPATVVPIVDGGTEGLAGQSRLILPRITSCYECALDSFPPARRFPLCTIAQTPRNAEHCVSYAMMVQWPEARPEDVLDGDDPEHVRWLYEQALERAQKYRIEGVTYAHTLGVVKNIIPAVASSNAIVSASCANEVVKLLTFASQSLNNWMSYAGGDGVYGRTFVYAMKETCPVSTATKRTTKVDPQSTLREFLETMKGGELRLHDPSVVGNENTLYMRNPKALEATTRPNLDKRMDALVENGEHLSITDPILASGSLTIVVLFT
uniref:NEDD8-activating enzyme E1 catalytic subunit n=1 Tax=Corethron hystrix TaxID=216773 RepID=A0A7S1FS63_9STRA|mmetsp:Transcript_27260/g.62575  ORF Transcript_27260/g.62575 Transcript_27260/m.62575 type:complete len:508 (+) Transcript_27260:104-1627(+)